MSRHPAADAALLARAKRFGDEITTDRVVEVLLQHYQIENRGPGVANPCVCGWGEWGACHARHVAKTLAAAGLLAP